MQNNLKITKKQRRAKWKPIKWSNEEKRLLKDTNHQPFIPSYNTMKKIIFILIALSSFGFTSASAAILNCSDGQETTIEINKNPICTSKYCKQIVTKIANQTVYCAKPKIK